METEVHVCWQKLSSWPCNHLLAGQILFDHQDQRAWALPHQVCRYKAVGTVLVLFSVRNIATRSIQATEFSFISSSPAGWLHPANGWWPFLDEMTPCIGVLCHQSVQGSFSYLCEVKPATPKQINLKSIFYLLVPLLVWFVLCWGNWESAIFSTFGKVSGKCRCRTRVGSTCPCQCHSRGQGCLQPARWLPGHLPNQPSANSKNPEVTWRQKRLNIC